ncbi:BlaI/MecI/CopY family transcriptional regulator, partial [Gemmatimonadota bacterium]
MNVLWRLGSGTVAEVQKGLLDSLAYTTVLTILRTLEKKGYARHEAEGRAHRYLPRSSPSSQPFRRRWVRRIRRKPKKRRTPEAILHRARRGVSRRWRREMVGR